jgi:hypothetical protein
MGPMGDGKILLSFWPSFTACIWLLVWWMPDRQLYIGFLLYHFSHTFKLTFSKLCTAAMDMVKYVIFWRVGLFLKSLHVVELCNFFSMFWIDGTYIVLSTLLIHLGWNSSNFAHFFKNTLKLCMWLFGSAWTFFQKWNFVIFFSILRVDSTCIDFE